MISTIRDLQGGEELGFTLHLCIFYITVIHDEESLGGFVAGDLMCKMSPIRKCLFTKFTNIKIVGIA